jgi:hypothetical protein
MICSDATGADENAVVGTDTGLCELVTGTALAMGADAGVGVGVDLSIVESCAALALETAEVRSLDFRWRFAAGTAEVLFGVGC